MKFAIFYTIAQRSEIKLRHNFHSWLYFHPSNREVRVEVKSAVVPRFPMPFARRQESSLYSGSVGKGVQP
jgi:hypothetical protein